MFFHNLFYIVDQFEILSHRGLKSKQFELIIQSGDSS